MKFYIAEGDVKAKLLALREQQNIVIKARRKLVKEFRAKGHTTQQHLMVGLVFDSPPPLPWKLSKRLSKHVPNTYTPNNSKEGIELRRRMQHECTDPVDRFTVSNAVGVEPFFPGSFTVSAFTVLCGKVVVGLDDRHDPKHELKRISDVEYERLLAKAKAK